MRAAALLAVLAVSAQDSAAEETLPRRVRAIVLHTLGNPSYHVPENRFVFFTPARTQALWKRGFGTHWIVWTDGSLWPRRGIRGEARGWTPDTRHPAGAAARRRLAWEAAPVYSHVYNGNSRTLGIELAHSGRSNDPFPRSQLDTLAWLLRTLIGMSEGRLTARSIAGHKDLDTRPAYASSRCARPGCPVFVDGQGRPYRRRVDPPEALFAALAERGLAVPRPPGGDVELQRAERLPAGVRPGVARLGGAAGRSRQVSR